MQYRAAKGSAGRFESWTCPKNAGTGRFGGMWNGPESIFAVIDNDAGMKSKYSILVSYVET